MLYSYGYVVHLILIKLSISGTSVSSFLILRELRTTVHIDIPLYRLSIFDSFYKQSLKSSFTYIFVLLISSDELFIHLNYVLSDMRTAKFGEKRILVLNVARGSEFAQ